jgi:predicted Zn-dependent protease
LSPNQDAIVQLSLGQGESVDEAAQAFLGQEGLQSGGASRSNVNGLPAVWGSFMATTSDGTQLGGLVVFIDYGELIYQVLGYTMLAKLNSYDPSFRQSFNSFDRLTERAALEVQPARLDIIELDRAMTLGEFANRYPSSASIEMLELINGVERTATVPAGEWLKRVVGELPPGN